MARLKPAGIALAAVCLGAAPLAAQQVGYVNTNDILANMPAVQQAEAELDSLTQKLETEGQAALQSYRDAVADLQRRVDAGELSPVQQQEERTALNQRQADINALRNSGVTQVETRRREIFAPIREQISTAIAEVAQEAGATIVIDAAAVLYADDATDLTPQVKAELGF